MIILAFFLSFYPLKFEAPVTSTFMEARSLHFHTGIDFSTGGRCGVPVYSPVNGYVVRIKVSYIGMGKAIYIRDSTQKVYVFAHLSGFSGPLDSIVRERQLRTTEYTQDLWFEPGMISVKKGELIGYSGKSGYGPPHLHFEVRRGFEIALNPLPFLGIRDTIPPEIKFIDVVPLTSESYIDGLPVPRKVYLEDSTDTLFIEGDFGIEASAVDYVNNRSYETVPYSFKLLIDGDTLFSLRFDSLDFREFGLSRSLYRLEGRHYSGALIRLYPPDLRGVDSHPNWPGAAYENGDHLIEVVVSDLAGNERKFSIPYRIGAAKWKVDDFRWDFEEKGFAVKMTDSGCLLGLSPEKSVTFNGQPLEPLGESSEYRLFFLSEQGKAIIGDGMDREFLLAEVTPDSFFLPFGDFYLRARRGVALYPFFVFVMEEGDPPRIAGDLEVATGRLILLPERPPLRGRFEIGLSKDGGRDLCLFRINGDRAEFRGSSSKGYTEDFGVFAFARDTIPPELVRLIGTRRGLYGVIEDRGAGVDPFSLDVTCDGQWIPADYDPETGELSYRGLESGGHRIEIRVSDRAGNETGFSKYIVVK